MLRNARAVNDKVRLLVSLGTALIEAKTDGTDLDGAVADSVGWDRLAASIAEANELTRPDKADLPALAMRAWPVLHRLGPLFLATLQLRAAPAAGSTLRAVELLQVAYGSGGRRCLGSLPVSFLQPDATPRSARLLPAATSAAPGKQPRSWPCVAGCARATSGWRAAGSGGPWRTSSSRPPCSRPCATPDRCPLQCRRPRRSTWKGAAPCLTGAWPKWLPKPRPIRWTTCGSQRRAEGDPAKAVTPEAAEAVADRLYGMVPSVRVTDMLAEADGWSGFSRAFTHLHTGLPAADPRVVLTAVLADATWA